MTQLSQVSGSSLNTKGESSIQTRRLDRVWLAGLGRRKVEFQSPYTNRLLAWFASVSRESLIRQRRTQKRLTNQVGMSQCRQAQETARPWEATRIGPVTGDWYSPAPRVQSRGCQIAKRTQVKEVVRSVR